MCDRIQKQPPEVFYKKRCSEKQEQRCHLILKRLQHRFFPVNIAKFLRTPILRKSASGCCLFCLATILNPSWRKVMQLLLIYSQDLLQKLSKSSQKLTQWIQELHFHGFNMHLFCPQVSTSKLRKLSKLSWEAA